MKKMGYIDIIKKKILLMPNNMIYTFLCLLGITVNYIFGFVCEDNVYLLG